MDKKAVRPIKVLLPGALVDRVDEALQQGLGGFRTRHALFEEAIVYYLQELEDLQELQPLLEEPAPPSSHRSAGRSQVRGPANVDTRRIVNEETTAKPIPPSSVALSKTPQWDKYLKTVSSIEELAISGANASASIDEKSNVSRPDQGPILGLHNRDWPTLQALDLLAEMTATGPVPCNDFYNVATANGWNLSAALRAYENKSTGKLSALLPSNHEKAKAAESNYRSFALGWISKNAEGESVATSGPLFKWSCAGIAWRDKELHIGLTDSGVKLLKGVAGLMPSAPHETHFARFFLNHITQYGHDDWIFLKSLLDDLANRPIRKELVAIVQQRQNSSESVAASLVQGYVARGREWGLIEPKQVDGRYVLSRFGEELLSEHGTIKTSVTQRKAS